MSRNYERPLAGLELAERPDEDIDTSDIPPLDEAFWAKAIVSGPRTKPIVSLRLTEEVIDYFKAEFPKGYTSRMAAVLTAYVDAHKPR